MPAPFDAYLASIAADLKGGHATEHTYRPARSPRWCTNCTG
jgi:hypothetical protein